MRRPQGECGVGSARDAGIGQRACTSSRLAFMALTRRSSGAARPVRSTSGQTLVAQLFAQAVGQPVGQVVAQLVGQRAAVDGGTRPARSAHAGPARRAGRLGVALPGQDGQPAFQRAAALPSAPGAAAAGAGAARCRWSRPACGAHARPGRGACGRTATPGHRRGVELEHGTQQFTHSRAFGCMRGLSCPPCRSARPAPCSTGRYRLTRAVYQCSGAPQRNAGAAGAVPAAVQAKWRLGAGLLHVL
jgi:hypothetical protein